MYAVLRLFIIWSISFLSAFGQTDYPLLPEGDYLVYASVIDSYSDCTSERAKYRRSGLLLLKNTTDTISEYGFRFNFKRPEEIVMPRSRADSLLKQAVWKDFITSVTPNQFTQCRIVDRRLKPQCRQLIIWTAEMSKPYFGKNTLKPGFYGLQKDYKNFDSIISFSKVVYSRDGTKALCYFSEGSDGEAGAGYLTLLERRQNVWEPLCLIMLWIA